MLPDLHLTWFLTGDTVAAGAYYGKAVAILKEKEDYGVDYVKTLQGWGSLEAQARNSSRARSLFQECVRVSGKVNKVFRLTLISVSRLKVVLSVGLFSSHRHHLELTPSSMLSCFCTKLWVGSRGCELQRHNSVPIVALRYFEFDFLQAATGGTKELVEAGVYGLHGWAMLEQKLGNWGEARELLQRAADIQPGNAVVHQTRALLESQAHNYASARHHFRLGVTSAPEDVKCWQVSIFLMNLYTLHHVAALS